MRQALRILVPVAAAFAVLAPMPARASADRITLGGVRVRVHDGVGQIITVNHTVGYHAHLTFWTLRHGRWQRVEDVSDGRIGYGGLVAPLERVQGSGTTPLGTVRLISSFGRHPHREDWSLPYRRIRAGDYWVEDNGSHYYNRYRSKAQGGFRWWLPPSKTNGSERLRDYPTQYEYSIVTSYNREQVRHRGAGIFLHVNGSGATAGCVSGPRWFLRQLMWRLDPAEQPVMAVGR